MQLRSGMMAVARATQVTLNAVVVLPPMCLYFYHGHCRQPYPHRSFHTSLSNNRCLLPRLANPHVCQSPQSGSNLAVHTNYLHSWNPQISERLAIHLPPRDVNQCPRLQQRLRYRQQQSKSVQKSSKHPTPHPPQV